jgi:hypothetical protein
LMHWMTMRAVAVIATLAEPSGSGGGKKANISPEGKIRRLCKKPAEMWRFQLLGARGELGFHSCRRRYGSAAR